MQEFNCEPAFILKRTPYKENHYLLDIFSQHYGRLRATGRIAKQKTHRQTENLAPFRELRITGRQKTELANIFQSDIITYYPLNGKDYLAGIYLNELLLACTAPEQADNVLFSLYQRALETPAAAALRRIELHLISELGLIPERESDGAMYRLYLENEWFTLRPAKNGYDSNLITAIENGELPLAHPQLKQYLQTLLSVHQQRGSRSRSTAAALYQLLH